MKKLISIAAVVMIAFSVAFAQQEASKAKPACCASKEACAHHKGAEGKQCSKSDKKECSKKCEKDCKKACCANKGASSSADTTAAKPAGCSGHGHHH